MAERPRTVLHAGPETTSPPGPMKEIRAPRPADVGAHGRRRHRASAAPADFSHHGYAGSHPEVLRIRAGDAPCLFARIEAPPPARGRHRPCEETRTAVRHRRQQSDLPVDLDVRRHPTGKCDACAAGSTHGVLGQTRRTHARARAVPWRRTVRSGSATEARAARQCSACPGAAVTKRRSETCDRHSSADCRVGHRRGVVGKRHHLAFVLELAHVQQVRDVLEEDAGRMCRAESWPGASSAAVADVLTVDDEAITRRHRW